MTKADIVNEIAKETGLDKLTILNTVESFMETVNSLREIRALKRLSSHKNIISLIEVLL